MKLILLTFLLFFLTQGKTFAQEQYLVQLQQANQSKDLAQFLERELPLAKISLCSELWNIYLLDFPSPVADNFLTTLQAQPFTKAYEKNIDLTLRSTTPNDAFFIQNRLWHHEKMQSDKAWEFTTGGNTFFNDTIVVAVIDAGIQIDHEDLVNNIWINKAELPFNNIDDDGNGYIDDYYGWNFQNASDSLPIHQHGTSVAGIIGAEGNNEIGSVGVNWNVKIMNLLAHYDNTNIRQDKIVQAYEYIAKMRILYNSSNGEKGAFIVATNASFGIDRANASNFPIWCSIYDTLGELGILSVAATNNNRLDIDAVHDMPTACPSPYLIAVTESNSNDQLNAAYGKNTIDLAAPSNVLAPRMNNTYASFGGTSGATPQVSGAIALLHAYKNEDWAKAYREEPAQMAIQLKNIILRTVDKIPELNEKTVSGGRLNIGRAMQALNYLYAAPEETELLKIYPNPTQLHLNIVLRNSTRLAEVESLQIFDFLGREFTHLTRNVAQPYAETLQIEVKDLAAGLYIIVWRANGENFVAKFQKT